MMTAVVAVFVQGLSRSAAAAMELLVHGVGGIVGSDRLSAYNHLLLELQQRQFEQWHRYKDGTISWPALQHRCQRIWVAFETTLQLVVELGCQRGERTPWAKTLSTSRQRLQRSDALRRFLEIERIEPTNNAAERSLNQTVIQRKIIHDVHYAARGSRLLTVTTSLQQKSRDVWDFLVQGWIAHHRGGVIPSLMPVPRNTAIGPGVSDRLVMGDQFGLLRS
jgi:transposase